MKKTFDYFDTEPEFKGTELYHYTSPRALKGILKSNRLWFSNIYFLNDKSEMKYTYLILLELLEDLKHKLNFEFYEKMVNRAEYMTCNTYYKEESSVFSRLEYYVLCLSTEKNCLSLWSNYTKTNDKTGYNIAFSYKNLKDCVEAKGYEFFSFAKVCYDTEKQKKMITETLIKFNDLYKNAKNGKDKQKIFWELIDNFTIYSIFLKHPAFHMENEYRIVVGVRSHTHSEICEFEVQNGIFVPHIEHELPDPDEGSIINSVTISPTCEKDLAVYSVRKLLNSYSQYDVKIFTSDIPLRAQEN